MFLTMYVFKTGYSTTSVICSDDLIYNHLECYLSTVNPNRIIKGKFNATVTRNIRIKFHLDVNRPHCCQTS